MNNEIKEILEFKEDADYKKISCDEIKVLRDYITNLQQRIEKAIEYIKEHNVIVVNKEYIPDGISTAYDYELMNILNGDK